MSNCPEQASLNPRRGEYIGVVHRIIPVGTEHYALVLEFDSSGAKVLRNARAGQFVQAACRDLDDSVQSAPLLRRPFSIADICLSDNRLQLEIVFRVIGSGTRWLARRTTGDRINVLGPLGNGFCIPAAPATKVILIGGGVGLPPLFFLARQLRKAGFEGILAFAGAQTKEHFVSTIDKGNYDVASPLIPQRVLGHFNRSETECIAATDDGSFGYKGSVTAALEEYLTYNPDWSAAQVFACGPEGMLKAVAELTQRREMDCQVCMESYMACGIGLCQSCVVTMKEMTPSGERQYKLACKDGPVFDAKEILWD